MSRNSTNKINYGKDEKIKDLEEKNYCILDKKSISEVVLSSKYGILVIR